MYILKCLEIIQHNLGKAGAEISQSKGDVKISYDIYI